MDDVARSDRRTPSLSASDDSDVSSEPLPTRASSPTLATSNTRKPLPSLPPATRSSSSSSLRRSQYAPVSETIGSEIPDWPLRPPPSLGFQPHRSPSPLRHDVLARTEEVDIGDAVGLIVYDDDNNNTDIPQPIAGPSRNSMVNFDDGRSPQAQSSGTALPASLPPRHQPHQAAGRPVSTATRSSAHIVHFPVPEPAPPPRSAFCDLFDHDPILSSLLPCLSWTDFQSAVNTCAIIRRGVFEHPETRDLVLARFVPSYRKCMQLRNPEWLQDVPIEMRDLELLMISEEVHLHRYPTLALARLSALRPSMQLEDATERLTALVIAHSRFVLLLQSLVHSAQTPPSTDDADEPPIAPQPRGLRELTFPSPLYFTGPDAKEHPPLAPAPAPPTSRRPGVFRQPSISMPSLPHLSSSSSSSSTLTVAGAASPDLARHHHHHSDHKKLRSSPSGTISSIFGRGRPKVPLPPARSEPEALRLYGSSWRRRMPSLPPPRRPFASESGHSSSASTPPRSASDEEVFGALRRPHRRFVHGDARTSWSSASSASPREEIAPPAPPASLVLSPHDLRAAARRTRAPVLRTFVPAAAMTDAVVDACTAQLADAGLWDLLSAGDVVCNLGYVPPAEHGADATGAGANEEVRTWLLFDGTELRMFVPPAPPPLARPGALPSPLYYAHVIPTQQGAGGAIVNPRFVLTLPPAAAPPNLALVPDLTQLVNAPGAPRGRAKVKQHVWTARMHARAAPGLGAGWAGEWVFEAPGTFEGRQGVVDALKGGPGVAKEWEVVRERCTAGKIWFRLIEEHTNARTISSAH